MAIFMNFIKSIINVCPYSIAGKKCIEVVKRNKHVKKSVTSKIQNLNNGIKTGRNMLLVGVFCPFLWYSILSGCSKDFIILNLIHSGIIVGLGVLIIAINYLRILHSRSISVKK